ncbi:scoloptoxin SSD976-like [Oratosquilla oratoria]|uniref:scoloptoxin SSD976-like n=1 Tax=Oratosquilla oratoria TaxID=337810 RepID=UPI003F774115
MLLAYPVFSYWDDLGLEELVTGITDWYDEVNFVPSSMLESFDPSLVSQPINRYTQMVWGDTHEVGCGATYYDNCSLPESPSSLNKCLIYVCNYGKGGNFPMRPFYVQGEPASKCPFGQSNKYDGLCK